MIDPIGMETRLLMLLHNLIGVAILVLFYSVIWFCLRKSEKRTLQKIGLCNDIGEANALRVKLKKRRNRIIWLSAIGMATFTTTTVLYLYDELFIDSFIFTLADCLFLLYFCMFIFFNRSLNSILGNIQPMSPNEFYSCERSFCLFLRGFLTDELSRNILKVEDIPHGVFSEVHYVKDVEKQTGVKVFAIGNPKELDSPFGAQRVYLNNLTWQEDIQVMMDFSRQIHIRVCDTPSCLWELQQVQKWMDKVTLVVDDLKAYDELRKSKVLNMNLPPLEGDIGWTLYVLSYNASSGWEVTRKKLSPKGYVPVKNASDKGKPYRNRSIFRYYAIMFMLTFGILYCVPDIVTLAKEFHKWRESVKRSEWNEEQWASEIGKSCPLLIMNGCLLSHCFVEPNCFVFSIDVSNNTDQDSLCSTNLCNSLLSTVFLEDDSGKKMFYEKIYLTCHFIKIHLSLQDGSAMTFSITEDDMIKMGLFRWHIPSHRSEEEQREYMWSLWSPPTHA